MILISTFKPRENLQSLPVHNPCQTMKGTKTQKPSGNAIFSTVSVKVVCMADSCIDTLDMVDV